jgi:hypothetical protein
MKKKNPVRTVTRRIFTVVLISFFLMMGFPAASPADDVEDMKKQLKTLNGTGSVEWDIIRLLQLGS